MMKELNIQIPEGYEIDKEQSTFERIVFKEKKEEPISWETLPKVIGYSVDTYSEIFHDTTGYSIEMYKNVFKTRRQADAALALAQLSQLIPEYIRRYYPENPDWKPNWIGNYCIFVVENNIRMAASWNIQYFCAFPTWEIAKRFLKEQKELLEQAKPFL